MLAGGAESLPRRRLSDERAEGAAPREAGAAGPLADSRRGRPKLLRAAHRNPKARHLARFILVALYTGHPERGDLAAPVHAAHRGRARRHRSRPHLPPRRRADRDQETAAADSDSPQAACAPCADGSATAPGSWWTSTGSVSAPSRRRGGLRSAEAGIDHCHAPRFAPHRDHVGHATRASTSGRRPDTSA